MLGVRGHLFVLELSILPLSTILIFDFRIVPTEWYFWIFILFLVAFRRALYIFQDLTIPTKAMKIGIQQIKMTSQQ